MVISFRVSLDLLTSREYARTTMTLSWQQAAVALCVDWPLPTI